MRKVKKSFENLFFIDKSFKKSKSICSIIKVIIQNEEIGMMDLMNKFFIDLSSSKNPSDQNFINSGFSKITNVQEKRKSLEQSEKPIESQTVIISSVLKDHYESSVDKVSKSHVGNKRLSQNNNVTISLNNSKM